jgi:hypothetical protein
MGLFHRKKPTNIEIRQKHQVDITVGKKANQAMFDKTKQATKYLNEVLQENHIHIKIYSAVGGKTNKKGI